MKAELLCVGMLSLVLTVGNSSAEEMEKLALAETTVSEPTPKMVLSASKSKEADLKKHLLENIDIFGKSDMPAIYILAPDMGELEGMLLVRDFSRDPFFMQNIDREEFEMKMTLREFDEKDKEKEKEAESR